jgi:hypothetical protein
VDEVLQQAMEPVLRDLRGAGVAPPRIEDDDWTGDTDSASAMLRSPDGSGRGVYVSRLAPGFERVAAMADQVQEWAIEELWGQAPTNWPPCPPHPDSHPMSAAARGGAAVWECPVDETVIAPIGALCCGDAACGGASCGGHPGRR